MRAARCCNNRVEQAHQPTRIRERRMGRFRCPTSAQRFLSALARVSNLFRPGRHRLRAHEWRGGLTVSFTTWQQVVGLSVS